jgi:hypothetical protein
MREGKNEIRLKARARTTSPPQAAARRGKDHDDDDDAGEGEDNIKEVKQLMYTMVFGLKTVDWCISNFRNNGKRQCIMDEEECGIVADFLENGLRCFHIYGVKSDLLTKSGGDEGKSSQDEKDILEHFASVFTVLDIRSFRDVFSVQIETLFDQIVKYYQLPMLIIPQHFLSSSNVSKSFADILLSFLVKRMERMAEPPPKPKPKTKDAKDARDTPNSVATIMLSLFRIVFGSVTLFAENEAVLRPHLNSIVSKAMQLAMEVKHPMNYFSLLRVLFRSIGGGKFELLYKEFLPLLPDLQRGLMTMQQREPANIKELSIELCLTVPARLSSLLPFIPLLMKAVLLALQEKDEQVIKLGLRTVEFWVDNLNPEYLYPYMCEVLSDLMRSLCALLRPLPSPFGSTALNVLGKLGGRNRRFLIESFNLEYRPNPEAGLTLHGSEESTFLELVKSMIIASGDSALHEDPTNSDEFIKGLTRHFALVFAVGRPRVAQSELTELDPMVFLDAIVAALCHRKYFKAAKKVLVNLLDTLVLVVGAEATAVKPVTAELLSKLSHCCFEDVWEHRHAGCVGLSLLYDKLQPKWIQANQGELIRALMFTFRNTACEDSKMTADRANATLTFIVKTATFSILGSRSHAARPPALQHEAARTTTRGRPRVTQQGRPHYNTRPPASHGARPPALQHEAARKSRGEAARAPTRGRPRYNTRPHALQREAARVSTKLRPRGAFP